MDLKMRDVSKMLKVSVSTIRRWVAEGKIPAYKLGNQYRFSPMEIEAWVLKRKIGQDDITDIDETKNTHTNHDNELPKQGSNKFSLFRAIHKGDVLTSIKGTTKEEVIKEAMGPLAVELSMDPDLITELLLDRERMMPTALNKGIAVPHSRDIMLKRQQDVVAVAFLENPIPYGALDGEDVHTLFFLFASDDTRHLNLLAKIAHLASSDEAQKLFKKRPSKIELAQFVKNWESSLDSME